MVSIFAMPPAKLLSSAITDQLRFNRNLCLLYDVYVCDEPYEQPRMERPSTISFIAMTISLSSYTRTPMIFLWIWTGIGFVMTDVV